MVSCRLVAVCMALQTTIVAILESEQLHLHCRFPHHTIYRPLSFALVPSTTGPTSGHIVDQRDRASRRSVDEEHTVATSHRHRREYQGRLCTYHFIKAAQRCCGQYCYHERPATGRKTGGPSGVLHSSTRLIVRASTCLRRFTAGDLLPHIHERWEQIRQAVRHLFALRAQGQRSGSNPKAYLPLVAQAYLTLALLAQIFCPSLQLVLVGTAPVIPLFLRKVGRHEDGIPDRREGWRVGQV